MKRLSQILILFFLPLAIGCSSQIETPTSLLPVIATIANTETPKPTSTPTTNPSPTLEQITIEFPEWVKKTETQILLVPVGTRNKGYEGMALFNAETGERFDIPYTEKMGDYFWMPSGSEFGFIPKNTNTAIIFSIKDGNVFEATLPDEAFQFFNTSSLPESAQVLNEKTNEPYIVLIDSFVSLSPDKRYFILPDLCDKVYFCIFEIETGKSINIHKFRDGQYYLFSEWAPNSKFVAIVEADYPSGGLDLFENLPVFQMSIYDVQSRQISNSYRGVTFPKWSPDSTKFLYQEWRKYRSWYWYAASPPCVFETATGRTNCYNEVVTTQGQQFSSVYWSPDQSMIGYVYNEGFCVIVVSSSMKRCVLKNSDLKQNIIKYEWSPDSNFISFIYDASCPFCDEVFEPQLAIANINSGLYFTIGDNINLTDLGVWR